MIVAKSILLCGFMGSGKTTVGRKLAQRLRRPFFDTDAMIEEQTGQSVSSIFETYGEAHFRELERKVIRHLSKTDEMAVISLGGGSLMDVTNGDAVKTAGILIFLEAGEAEIRARIVSATDRPLFNGRDLTDLIDQRIEGYRRADFSIPTDNKTPEDIVEKIIAVITV